MSPAPKARESTTPRSPLTERLKARLPSLGVALLQLGLLAFIASRVVQFHVVEDYREVVGNLETVHFRRELVGDPLLLALIVVGMVIPLLSVRIRREPVMLVAIQLAITGLILFVLWPLTQVFAQGFRAAQGAAGLSLIQFEKLLATPMVAKASLNTIARGGISAFLSTVIGT